MWPLFAVLFAIAALISFGISINRRDKRKATEMIEAMGGKVLKVRLMTDGSRRWTVKYISPNGDLRQAVLSMGRSPAIIGNEGYERVLRYDYEHSRTKDMLRNLMLAAEYGGLPGWESFQSLMRELVESPEQTLIIYERDGDSPPGRGFAPIRQCVETIRIHETSSDILHLSVFGHKIDVTSSVEGEPPNRVLRLWRVPTAEEG